ncbi:MAG TPA: hypothetical protein DDX85_03925 [Nitrospiraceae bacterium]|nr:hypothetical protein [Nitrospiraceae bacterium]
MDTNRILKVFIASPGDIIVERKIVREVCLGLNESELLRHLSVSLHTAMWGDVFPSAEDPQAMINRLVDECDILVCIFYKRVDTQPDWSESENLNKFLLAYDSWKSLKKPHVMCYFKDVKASIEDSPYSEVNQVNKLKEKIQKEHILFTEEFSAPYEFCEKIYDHIEKWVRDNTRKH